MYQTWSGKCRNEALRQLLNRKTEIVVLSSSPAACDGVWTTSEEMKAAMDGLGWRYVGELPAEDYPEDPAIYCFDPESSHADVLLALERINPQKPLRTSTDTRWTQMVNASLRSALA